MPADDRTPEEQARIDAIDLRDSMTRLRKAAARLAALTDEARRIGHDIDQAEELMRGILEGRRLADGPSPTLGYPPVQ